MQRETIVKIGSNLLTKNSQTDNHKTQKLFLVGVFEETAQLLQWQFFFVSSSRSVHFFCSFVQLLRQLTFRLSEAGERGFESRRKPQVFQCFQK